nr:deoxyribodipyrimidine photo-lyase [Verrucomicrobiales bacterium]
MARYHTVIHWFRRDLRLSDNVALQRATMDSDSVVPVYVSSSWKGAHQWTGPGRQAFLCGCLASLAKNIDHIGGRLIFRRGGVRAELENLINESQADAIYLNRDPDPYGREVEKSIRQLCREKGIGFHDFQDVVLHEPHEVLTGTGNPYKVYTPYSRTWFAQEKPGVVETVRKMRTPSSIFQGDVPTLTDWGLSFRGDLLREPGEKAARARLQNAVESAIGSYAGKRNDPAADATSHLGADLRYGTLSVREVFHRAEEALAVVKSGAERISIQTFQKQLAWREFFMAILHHFPEVLETDFNPDWRGLEW